MAQLVKNPTGRLGFDPWVGKIPCRRERLPTPVFWPGEFHGLYSPWGHKELDTTEWLSLSLSGLSCGMKDLQGGLQDPVLWPGIEPRPPASGAQGLSHWTTKEVLGWGLFFFLLTFVPSQKIFLLCNQQSIECLSNKIQFKVHAFNRGVALKIKY